MIKIGCCGIPKGLKEYQKLFNLTEIQKTFYLLPKENTAKYWRSVVPEGFEFTVKAWQLITHQATSPTYRKIKLDLTDRKKTGFFKPNDLIFFAYERTKEIAKILRAKFIIFQCPKSFTQIDENIRNIRNFFNQVYQNQGGEKIRYVLGPRGRWDDEVIKKLCDEFNLIHCVDPLFRRPVTKDIAYFRLHGLYSYKIIYNYKYSKDELLKVAEICKDFNEVYCLFNNLYMFEDALRFKGILMG